MASPALDSLVMDPSRPTAAFEPIAVDLRDYVDFRDSGPVTRRVFATDVVAVDLVALEPQQVIPARVLRTADAIYTVVGGRAWVVTDEAEVTLDPLQSVMIPSGIAHGVRNDAPDPLILQVVMSPPDDLPAPPAGPAESLASDRGGRSRPGLLDRLRRLLGG